MSLTITIDGVKCTAEAGQYITDVAKANNIYIPTLCNLEGIKPKGSCRVCTCIVNGRQMAACSTPVADGMVVENKTTELEDIRKVLVEVLFAEGNHFCPGCERSGSCELQALGYKYKTKVTGMGFDYKFPNRAIDASHEKILIDYNRCILCKRCIRSIKTDDGKSIFAFKKRGNKVIINVDPELASQLTDEKAQLAMDNCPVGAIIRKGKGFDGPIGRRQYDCTPIGSDIENNDGGTK